jgi:hypothetical protein
MPGIGVVRMISRTEVVELGSLPGVLAFCVWALMAGERTSRRVRMVWSGRRGSQESIYRVLAFVWTRYRDCG